MVPQPSNTGSFSSEEALDENTDDLEPSKSQLKRDADDVRDFARELVILPPRKLKRLALPLDIEEAIKKCPPASTRGAHKRHLQFISKLLRKNGDVDEIRSRLENPITPTSKIQPHEDMRDKLIAEFAECVDTLRQEYPTANLQKVRQLVRQANAIGPSDTEGDSEIDPAVKKKAVKAKKALLALLRDSAQA